MKAIVLPLALCAALAGCADVGTVAYGGAPGYYPYSAYPYGAYGYTVPDADYLFGAPAVNFSYYGGRDRAWHGDRDRDHDHDRRERHEHREQH